MSLKEPDKPWSKVVTEALIDTQISFRERPATKDKVLATFEEFYNEKMLVNSIRTIPENHEDKAKHRVLEAWADGDFN